MVQARQAYDGAGGGQPRVLPGHSDAGEHHRDPGAVPRCGEAVVFGGAASWCRSIRQCAIVVLHTVPSSSGWRQQMGAARRSCSAPPALSRSCPNVALARVCLTALQKLPFSTTDTFCSFVAHTATKKMEARMEWVDKSSSRIWRGGLEARYWRYIKGSGGCCAGTACYHTGLGQQLLLAAPRSVASVCSASHTIVRLLFSAAACRLAFSLTYGLPLPCRRRLGA